MNVRASRRPNIFGIAQGKMLELGLPEKNRAKLTGE